MSVAEKVKSIIVEQLGVEADEVTSEASFTWRPTSSWVSGRRYRRRPTFAKKVVAHVSSGAFAATGLHGTSMSRLLASTTWAEISRASLS